MRNRLAGLAVLGLLLTACSGAGSDLVAPTDASLGKGVSEPNTAVNAQFKIVVPGYSYTVRYTTVCDDVTGLCTDLPQNHGQTGILGNDKCVDGALYKRTVNKKTGVVSPWNAGPTGVVPHPNCSDVVVVPETTIIVTFNEVANYVLSTGKNIQLNFNPFCTTDDFLVTTCASRYVHYTKSSNLTQGFGILYGRGSDNSEWAIDLGAVTETGNASLAGRTISAGAIELNGLGRSGTATFSW